MEGGSQNTERSKETKKKIRNESHFRRRRMLRPLVQLCLEFVCEHVDSCESLVGIEPRLQSIIFEYIKPHGRMTLDLFRKFEGEVLTNIEHFPYGMDKGCILHLLSMCPRKKKSRAQRKRERKARLSVIPGISNPQTTAPPLLQRLQNSVSPLQSLDLSALDDKLNWTEVFCSISHWACHLTHINLSKCCGLRTKDLAALSASHLQSTLRVLNLSNTFINNSGLPTLISLSQLQSLILTGCRQITEWHALAAFTSLTALTLRECNLTTLNLTSIASLSNLLYLDLSVNLNINFLFTLYQQPVLRSLVWLDLHRTSIGNQALAQLKQSTCTNLQVLNLSGTYLRLETNELSDLRAFPNLRILKLNHLSLPALFRSPSWTLPGNDDFAFGFVRNEKKNICTTTRIRIHP